MNQPLELRVAQLEKNLRFYRFCFIGILVIAGGLITMSFKHKNAAPDLIQAKAFQVVDDYGNVLVEMNREGGNGQISTYTPGRKRLVSLFTADGGSGAINTYDNDGDVIFKVTRTTSGGGYMALFNAEQKEIAEWGISDAEAGYFRLNDRNGNKLAWMTYTAGGGGYLSLLNNNVEMFRLSTPEAGGRMGVYNQYNTRVAYMGAQDTRDGNITVWNNSGTRTGALPQ
jgi:hypothetical protein